MVHLFHSAVHRNQRGIADSASDSDSDAKNTSPNLQRGGGAQDPAETSAGSSSSTGTTTQPWIPPPPPQHDPRRCRILRQRMLRQVPPRRLRRTRSQRRSRGPHTVLLRRRRSCSRARLHDAHDLRPHHSDVRFASAIAHGASGEQPLIRINVVMVSVKRRDRKWCLRLVLCVRP